ncbi:MAG: hypothetical protein WEE89_10915 [Gemmatimonadota bacterium]
MHDQRSRTGTVIGTVIDAAVRAAGCDGIVILNDGSPEASLLNHWCRRTLGEARVWSATSAGDSSRDMEALRYTARTMARERNALTANPANKTALLLGIGMPPEPLLPLGDLYATQIESMADSWSAPPEVLELVDNVRKFARDASNADIKPASGIYAVDEALRAMFEGWRPAQEAVSGLPEPTRGPFLEAVRRGRFWRERAGLIPKLSTRTIGIDLFA